MYCSQQKGEGGKKPDSLTQFSGYAQLSGYLLVTKVTFLYKWMFSL